MGHGDRGLPDDKPRGAPLAATKEQGKPPDMTKKGGKPPAATNKNAPGTGGPVFSAAPKEMEQASGFDRGKGQRHDEETGHLVNYCSKATTPLESCLSPTAICVCTIKFKMCWRRWR